MDRPIIPTMAEYVAGACNQNSKFLEFFEGNVDVRIAACKEKMPELYNSGIEAINAAAVYVNSVRIDCYIRAKLNDPSSVPFPAAVQEQPAIPQPQLLKTASEALDEIEIELSDLLKELVEKDDVPQAESVLKRVDDGLKLVESVRGSKEELAPLQKKYDECVAKLAVVNKSVEARKVHDEINFNLGLDYLRVPSNNDLLKLSLGMDIPLWHRLVITPQVAILDTTGKIGASYPKWQSDATGESKFVRDPERVVGYGGGLGLGVLAYRVPNFALLVGADGFIGRLADDYGPYRETVASASGKLQLRFFPIRDVGLGLSVGGGTYCSITNRECYGMFQSGIELFIPTNWNIH